MNVSCLLRVCPLLKVSTMDSARTTPIWTLKMMPVDDGDVEVVEGGTMCLGSSQGA